MSKISQEIIELFGNITEGFYKVLFPTLAGISIRIGIMVKNKKLTIVNLIGGLFTAVGCSVAFSPVLIEKLPDHYAYASIAIMAMFSEKIAVFLLEKFNVDKFFTDVISSYLDKFKKQ